MNNDFLSAQESQFSRWLKKEMVKSDLSVKEFAKKVGVTPGSVYGWLRGDNSPSPESRKRIIEVFKKTIPKKIMVTTPLFGMTCKKCDHVPECMSRAVNGYPILCESLTMNDLLVAALNDCVNIFVWWKDVDQDDYESLESLAVALNQEG